MTADTTDDVTVRRVVEEVVSNLGGATFS